MYFYFSSTSKIGKILTLILWRVGSGFVIDVRSKLYI